MPKTPYQILGESGVQQLANAFYDVMDEQTEAQEIRDMHQANLTNIKQKLFEYFSGWMGGPQLYSDKYGSVCLTDSHKPFKIKAEHRDQWLMCMDKALERINASEELTTMLKEPMFMVADTIHANCS